MSLRYLGKKVLWAFLTLFFVLSVNFFLFRVMPGDPVALLARSQRLTPEAIEQQRALFGLDQPLFQQYLTYLGQTARFEFGSDLISGQPVWGQITARIWPTVLLVGVGTSLAVVLGVLGGIKAGWKRGSRFDRNSTYGSLVLYATPEGWLGMLLLIVFFILLGCFLDGISMVVLTIAVLLPTVEAAGFDLVWFGIFIVLVVEMAQITPPVGFNLFVLQGMTRREVTWIARTALPLFALMIVAVVMTYFVPDVVLWLPRQLGYQG